MTQEEKTHKARLKSLAKARKTRQKNAEAKQEALAEHRTTYRAWLKEEKDAFLAHMDDPKNDKLLRAWRGVWKREPQWDNGK